MQQSFKHSSPLASPDQPYRPPPPHTGRRLLHMLMLRTSQKQSTAFAALERPDWMDGDQPM
eukprot:219355-Prorocentrum_lima.AAC.1